MKININEQVQVELTDFGKQVLIDENNETAKIINNPKFYKYANTFKDTGKGAYWTKGKWTTFQLWEICNYFGKYMRNGITNQCIKNNNLIYKPEKIK